MSKKSAKQTWYQIKRNLKAYNALDNNQKLNEYDLKLAYKHNQEMNEKLVAEMVVHLGMQDVPSDKIDELWEKLQEVTGETDFTYAWVMGDGSWC